MIAAERERPRSGRGAQSQAARFFAALFRDEREAETEQRDERVERDSLGRIEQLDLQLAERLLQRFHLDAAAVETDVGDRLAAAHDMNVVPARLHDEERLKRRVADQQQHAVAQLARRPAARVVVGANRRLPLVADAQAALLAARALERGGAPLADLADAQAVAQGLQARDMRIKIGVALPLNITFREKLEMANVEEAEQPVKDPVVVDAKLGFDFYAHTVLCALRHGFRLAILALQPICGGVGLGAGRSLAPSPTPPHMVKL